MPELEAQIKRITRKNGAPLVGIASRQRLDDASPSGNPDYVLPSAESVISYAIALDRKTTRDFISKKDRLSHYEERKRIVQSLYKIGDRLPDFLKSLGFEAVVVDINNTYRPEPGASDIAEMTEFIPDSAHRYAAVAAGIGRLGWSGNLLITDWERWWNWAPLLLQLN